MRRLLPLTLSLCLAACRCGGPEGAIRLELQLDGFRPGCIEVVAHDVASPEANRTAATVPPNADPTDTTYTVAVFRPEAWSREVRVSASAREGACSGNVVATASAEVTVGSEVEVVHLVLGAVDADGDGFVAPAGNGTDCNDGDSDVHPGAPERCDGVDQNCADGADEGFALGAACSSNDCAGLVLCAPDGGTMCSTDGLRWFPDQDGDQYGNPDAGGIAACTGPTGFVDNADDCDDGDPQVSPEGVESCDGRDNNCQGEVDEPFAVGQACEAGGCPGVNVCDSASSARCEVGPPVAYVVDSDLDGHGRLDGLESFACNGYGPDAGQSTVADDCDDANAGIHPGAPERCDGVDNTCSGDVDEGYGVGNTCTPQGGGCAGQTACEVDGGTRCDAPNATLAYVDDDLDGFGRSGLTLPTLQCVGPGSGYSTTNNDCDDGYAYTHPGAAELCDARDNDCDDAVDDGAGCPAGPAWVIGGVGGNGQDWYTVSSWTDGGTGVWVAGNGDELQVKRPSVTTNSFENKSNDCGGSAIWLASWADPGSGRVYLGGYDSALFRHEVESGSCERTDAGSGLAVVSGLHGFGTRDSTALLAVAQNGRSGWWDGGESLARLPDVSSCLEDVHGLSPQLTFAVGGPASCGTVDSPRIFLLDGGWQAMSTAGLPNAKLGSVHVVNRRLAYAAGGAGTSGPASLVVWNGSSWSSHSTPPGLTQLNGVHAFGRTSVFVIGGTQLWGFDGGTWTQLAPANTKPLWNITANGPDDVWVVGDDGTVIHWPD